MKIAKGILGLVLAITIAVISNPVSARAEEVLQVMQIENINSRVADTTVTYEGTNNFVRSVQSRGNGIIAATLEVTPRTDEILIGMSTTASFTATKVGVKEVYVQEKVWYGWKTIAQAADYATSTSTYSGQAHCTNATKGKTYRVLCTHYAIESNGTEHTVSNQSEEFVYN